jgi:hypothetical protein
MTPFRIGSFEKFKSSKLSQYDYLLPNNWDHTLYYCHSIANISRYTSNTPENIVARKLLNAWPSSTVHFLHVFKYLAPFYKMKYGHCGGYMEFFL